jgi:hypothetical protein
VTSRNDAVMCGFDARIVIALPIVGGLVLIRFQ